MSDTVRTRDVSRLEGFSDAIFGFALTLLVVSLETPKDLAGLRNVVGSFLPFGITFAWVSWIWYQHNLFFRRYGLQDAWTTFLNCALLFVVLVYVFPLKFLTLALIGRFTMTATDLPGVLPEQWPLVMTLYSTGVLLIFGIFVLLYNHAWRRRNAIELTPLEDVVLMFARRGHMLSTGLAVISLLLVWALPRQIAYAGLIYTLMGPLHAWNGYRSGAEQERIRAKRLGVSLSEEHAGA